MITIQTQAEVNNKSPKQVFDWWLNLDSEKYCSWFHDHKAWVWKRERPENGTNLGRKVFIHELVEDFEFRFHGKLADMDENRYLLFKHSYLPLSFSFHFEPSDTGTRVVFTLNAGFRGFIGWLTDPIIRFTNRKNLEKSHVAEEHKLLENIL